MDLGERRELNNGFGTALSRAFEFALIPLLFAIPGWLLDRWLGTGPFLALVTGLFGLAGITARMWFEYAPPNVRSNVAPAIQPRASLMWRRYCVLLVGGAPGW